MLTREEDVEIHALHQAGVVDLGDRPPYRQESPNDPQLHQRGDHARRAQTGR